MSYKPIPFDHAFDMVLDRNNTISELKQRVAELEEVQVVITTGLDLASRGKEESELKVTRLEGELRRSCSEINGLNNRLSACDASIEDLERSIGITGATEYLDLSFPKVDGHERILLENQDGDRIVGKWVNAAYRIPMPALQAQIAELEGELAREQSELQVELDVRADAEDLVIELQAQLDRAPKSAAKLIDQGKRIRSLEQQQEGIRVWANRAGWKGVVPLYKWVMDYVDRATKKRPMVVTTLVNGSHPQQHRRTEDGYDPPLPEGHELADSGDRKPAEPRPMSEAPRNYCERCSFTTLVSRDGGPCKQCGAWLPTSSGGEGE